MRPFLPDLGRRTQIMGIVNATPDSFSDGGRFQAPEEALAHARRLAAEGADLVDVGGESTRPGHVPVPAEEEQRRVVPVVAALAGGLAPLPVSIDTWKASTARAALRAGARIVNDVWGLQRDPAMADAVAEFGAGVVIMHNREAVDARIDILDDMLRFFDRSLSLARRAGIPEANVALDPGVGFGKTWEQHREALRRLPELRRLGFPLLVGVSRKSLLGPDHDRSTAPRDRLHGSVAAHVAAIVWGADIVRVHDVAAHREAAQVADALARTGHA